MAASLAIILILGLFMNRMFEKIKLPGLLGMLLVGVFMGPYGLDMISSEIMTISSDLRKIALIVILLRAGFGLNRDQLNKVGGAAIRMSSIPGIMEGFAVLFIAMYLFDIPFVEAAMGAVPLSLGVPSGELILAISVLSIVVTAPLGAIGIKIAGEKLLD